MARRICVISGSRAEYGQLVPLLRELNESRQVTLRLVVTGAHLSPLLGHTVDYIRSAPWEIAEEVDITADSDSAVDVTSSLGYGVIKLGQTFERLKPHIVVLTGDRYEMLAAAQAALIHNIPVAHLHGGEVTRGSVDNAIRHALTKMAHIHFVGAEPYYTRVVQMGEDPSKVFLINPLPAENVANTGFLKWREFEDVMLCQTPTRPYVVVSWHPETASQQSARTHINKVLAAVRELTEQFWPVFIESNADKGGLSVNKALHRFIRKHKRGQVFSSLEHETYLNLLKYASLFLGNSSAGVHECPYLGTPSINIGDRQSGREIPEGVTSCEVDTAAIVQSARQALAAVRKKRKPVIPNNAAFITHVLATIPLKGITKKGFYDLRDS